VVFAPGLVAYQPPLVVPGLDTLNVGVS
jgi:hypothetical protein